MEPKFKNKPFFCNTRKQFFGEYKLRVKYPFNFP